MWRFSCFNALRQFHWSYILHQSHHYHRRCCICIFCNYQISTCAKKLFRIFIWFKNLKQSLFKGNLEDHIENFSRIHRNHTDWEFKYLVIVDQIGPNFSRRCRHQVCAIFLCAILNLQILQKIDLIIH